MPITSITHNKITPLLPITSNTYNKITSLLPITSNTYNKITPLLPIISITYNKITPLLPITSITYNNITPLLPITSVRTPNNYTAYIHWYTFISSYLRICRASLTELTIQRSSQHGSPEEIRMSSDNESKGGSPVRILLRIAEGSFHIEVPILVKAWCWEVQSVQVANRSTRSADLREREEGEDTGFRTRPHRYFEAYRQLYRYWTCTVICTVYISHTATFN